MSAPRSEQSSGRDVARARRRFYGGSCELCFREPRTHALGGVRFGDACYSRVLAVAKAAGMGRRVVAARVSALSALSAGGL